MTKGERNKDKRDKGERETKIKGIRGRETKERDQLKF